MRKLAIIGIFILLLITVVITVAVIDEGFRNATYGAFEGTLIIPIHDWVVATWLDIGVAGFTWIAAASVGITIVGALFGYFICYGLFYKKIYQGKIRGQSGTPSHEHQAAPSSSGNVIPITVTPSAPRSAPTQPQPPKDSEA